MLDRRKVELMTRLAFYEQTDGKEDFKVSEYYRKDYTSMHIICSILWTTIGYACIVGIAVLLGIEKILGNMSNTFIMMLGGIVILGYLSLTIAYAIITGYIYNAKDKDARQRVKKYNHDLTRLLRLYEKEKK